VKVLIACSVLAALLASCGDGEPEAPSEPPAELLREAVANPAQSGESDISLDLALEGDSLLAGPSSVGLDGPFALDPEGGIPSFDFALDAEVAGFGVDGELVSTGDDAYVVFFGENYRVGPEQFDALDEQLGTAGAAGLGLRIDRWFVDPRYAGAEEVEGTETERIEGTLDRRRAGADLANLLSAFGAPPVLAEAAFRAGSGPIEAWVAFDDHTIRRVRAQFPFKVPPALRERAGGISGGAAAIDAEISDVGAEVTVEPPPGGGFQPIEQLIDRLSSLAGLAL
jgi:hypothetical protein